MSTDSENSMQIERCCASESPRHWLLQVLIPIPLEPLGTRLVQRDDLGPLVEALKLLVAHGPLQEMQHADNDKVGVRH